MAQKPPPFPSLAAIGEELRKPAPPRPDPRVDGAPAPPVARPRARQDTLPGQGFDETLPSPAPPRSLSPPPQELAPDPASVHAAHVRARSLVAASGTPGAPVVVETAEAPPPSLRASVRGIRAWASRNAKILTWLAGVLTAGGSATALRDQIVHALGLATQTDVAPLRAELAAAKATLETVQRERAYESRELQRDLDKIREESDRRDDSQDTQIERLRRRAVEPRGMTVTPGN